MFTNKSKVEIQVYTLDRISKKNDENKKMITPNGQGTSQATLDSGGSTIDITFSIVGKNDKNISEENITAWMLRRAPLESPICPTICNSKNLRSADTRRRGSRLSSCDIAGPDQERPNWGLADRAIEQLWRA